MRQERAGGRRRAVAVEHRVVSVDGRSQDAVGTQSLFGDFDSLIHWKFAAKVPSGKTGQRR